MVNHSPSVSEEYGTSTQSTSRMRPCSSGSERSAVAGSRNCRPKTSTTSLSTDSATAAATARAAHSCAGGQPGRYSACTTTRWVAAASRANCSSVAPNAVSRSGGSSGNSVIDRVSTLISGLSSICRASPCTGSASRPVRAATAVFALTFGSPVIGTR